MKRCPPRRAAGFTLTEILVSLVVGLVLIGAVVTLVIGNSRSRNAFEQIGQQMETGRFAARLLAEDVRHGGYYGEFFDVGAAPAALPDPCATAPASLAGALPLALQGYDAPATVPSPLSACLPDANHVPGTDILVVRRAATTVTTPPLLSGDVYLQSTPLGQVLASGADPAPFATLKKKDGSAADIRKYHVHIYFVSPCSVPAGGGDVCTGPSDDDGAPIPTLKRLELQPGSPGAVFQLAPLAEGIDDLQLDYGIDGDGDGTPDSYLAAPATTDWANVTAVQIHLLARESRRTPGYQDDKQYALGLAGLTAARNDGFRRHLYSLLARAVNVAGRRE